MCGRGRDIFWGFGVKEVVLVCGRERHIFFGLKLPCLLRRLWSSTTNAAKKDMPSPASLLFLWLFFFLGVWVLVFGLSVALFFCGNWVVLRNLFKGI